MFKNILIRHHINEVIALLEEHNGTLVNHNLVLIKDKKYQQVIPILEASGCIKVTREWGGSIIMIATTNRGFSVYSLERHDVWVNRIIGFVSGVLVTVTADFISHALL